MLLEQIRQEGLWRDDRYQEVNAACIEALHSDMRPAPSPFLQCHLLPSLLSSSEAPWSDFIPQGFLTIPAVCFAHVPLGQLILYNPGAQRTLQNHLETYRMCSMQMRSQNAYCLPSPPSRSEERKGTSKDTTNQNTVQRDETLNKISSLFRVRFCSQQPR